ITAFNTGFTLQDSQVVGNTTGVDFDGVDATGVTFDNATIAENTLNGVLIHDSDTTDGFDSSFNDFVIQNSHLGQVLDAMGNQIFGGNGGSGFLAGNSTFTGVAFIGSFFNGNGTGLAGGNGIRFVNSTISGQVNPQGVALFNTGF